MKFEIRSMRPIELGLVFAWMADDEDSGEGPMWWSDSAGLVVKRWEEASGLTELELSTIVTDVTAAAEDYHTHAGSVRSLCALPAPVVTTADVSGRTRVVGAFATGHSAPVGFAVSRTGEPFSIDAMGARRAWRSRGVGTAIAQEFIGTARTAGQAKFSLDSKPGAVAFWVRQGLRLDRGSNKAMTLQLTEACTEESPETSSGRPGSSYYS